MKTEHDEPLLADAAGTSHAIKVNECVNLQWKDIYYSIDMGDGAPRKQILNGVSGTLNTGHLLAILGPSGSGKTSLLNTLAVTNLLIRIEGSHFEYKQYPRDPTYPYICYTRGSI